MRYALCAVFSLVWLTICPLSGPARAAERPVRAMPPDTLRPDSMPASPMRNGFATDADQRVPTPTDRQRLRRPVEKKHWRFTYNHFRTLITFVGLVLEASLTVFCLWVGIAFVGEQSRAGTGAVWDLTGLIRFIGVGFLLLGVAGLVLLLSIHCPPPTRSR